jgi:hypothetical protein
MFTIAFRDGSDGQLVWGARPDYNNEYLSDYRKDLTFYARIGESLMDFASLTGDISQSDNPYILLAGEYAEGISENSFFLVHLKEYLDLMIIDAKFCSLDCFMFFLDMMGMSIPAFHYQMLRKDGHEDDCIEEAVPNDENMSSFERSLRGFLEVGESVYDVPLTVYDCETVEDACCASLHFLITHHFNIRKCRNCGKYFVAYNRSDSVYCDRISPFNSNATCAADGAARTYRESLKNDSLKQLISNTQTLWRMRKKRHPEYAELQEDVKKFAAKLNRMRADYKAGQITEEEFRDWLLMSRQY